MSELKPGDRMRVTIEGTYTRGNHIKHPGTYGPDRLFEVMSSADDTVTVEKIEPPVVVFKPGDILRGKHTGRIFTYTEDGIFVFPGGSRVKPWDEERITSEYYERVDLG